MTPLVSQVSCFGLCCQDLEASVAFYTKVLGVRFQRCEYATVFYEATVGSQRLRLCAAGGMAGTAGTRLEFESTAGRSNPQELAEHLRTTEGLDARVENIGIDLWLRSAWDRWVVVVTDPDRNEVVLRRRLMGWPRNLRDHIRDAPGFIYTLLQRTWDQWIDRLQYRFDLTRISRKDISGFSHFVASRQGLYAVSTKDYRRIMSGQFYGLTLHNGDAYAFQAHGNVRSMRKSGRIVKLEIDRGANSIRIRKATVVAKGLDNGCHQIDFVGDALYVVDTYNHRVLRLNREFSVEAEYWPMGQQGAARSEDAHMNSLVRHGDEFWLLLHNGPRRKYSEILVLDREFRLQRTLTLHASRAHNIVFVEKGRFLVCDSAGGYLVDEAGIVKNVGTMMLRGLSIDDGSVVVGDSYYTTRFGRRYIPGHVYFYDRAFNQVAVVALPAAPTEIRKIDGVDYSLSNFHGHLQRRDGGDDELARPQTRRTCAAT